MANSTWTAQSPIPCQLCKNEVVINWKCTDCELLLCDNCKINIHPRFKSSEKHRVVSIGDIGNDISDHIKSLHISEIISSVLNTYQTELPCIDKIMCNDDDDVFISCSRDFENYNFINARFRKDSIKVLQEFDIECQDFAVNRQREIIFSPVPRLELKGKAQTGIVRTILKADPMIILAIHVNKHGKLVLGLRDQGLKFPVTDFSVRQIAVLGVDYKRKATFEHDENGRKLFNYAFRIISDSENNIYTQDMINDEGHGRVVGLDMNGRKKFIYKGHSIMNTSDTPFMPCDIAITPNNILLITDINNHAMHAINAKGEMCGLQSTERLGIRFPCSLSFDSEGFLLIGCEADEEETKSQAKIHAVKITL